MSLFGNNGVSLFVPDHHVIDVAMILLEADKALLDQHSSAITEVMARQVLDVCPALPVGPAISLYLPLPAEVKASHAEHNQAQEVVSVFSEFLVAIVVHWVSRFVAVEVVLV